MTGTSMDPVVLRTAAHLEQKVDHIARRLVHTYSERIPAYGSADSDTIADALRSARDAVLAALGAVTGKVDTAQLSQALSEMGRKRALDGIALHDVLLANIVAIEVLWEEIAALSEWESDTQRADTQEVFMRSAMELLQEAVSGLASGYIEIERGRVADREHEFQALLETIAGLRDEDRRHQERAERHGIDLRALKWCVVIRSEEGRTGREIGILRDRNPGSVVGRIGRKIVGFFPGQEPPAIEEGAAGVATCEDGPAGYRRALAALEVARHTNKRCIRYEEVVPLAMLLNGPEEDREAFVRAQLGPLINDPMGADLIRSLREYYRQGQSVAAASRSLFVHRHTLEYRLSRIEAALGVDIRDPHNRLLLEFALQLHRD